MSPPSDPLDPVLADALFRPVRAGNAFEETMERMLQAIRLGVVPPGGRLPPERELSSRLGVSRVTLREALRALQESGHVESRRGRYGGTFVRLPSSDPLPLPSDDIEDILTLRYTLETGAAEVAASRSLTPQVRRHLRGCLADASTAGVDHYRRTDSRLHLAIAEATAAPSLTAAVADVRTRLNALLAALPLIPANLTHSNDQHKTIIDAILDGDAGAARLAMAEHLAGTAALIRGFLA
ncbi:FadR/GntR family transcriptional regulator [Actinokineospora globicatena]|uniref:GntR family transcriptional regulator n=1 Tax=Actinokineospora globicatena TaxID=103729 RepID=A0A9W6VA46_9PSEU|nr:FCD domain-containing protein [Actinokineospora globicatena]MCP2305039.1 DNA-binding transcriptional regulator, FadR family [Actinokineospora globicatena]GLW80502.1 GntR family transcriptional regulator [Actinokineospora globicatena]GLW87330.1 GntR family transcriptional regulator [Actinokineospora globicatena]GLW93947.1 GntR family transcriptional regulator [Actinokineospora globicatena]